MSHVNIPSHIVMWLHILVKALYRFGAIDSDGVSGMQHGPAVGLRSTNVVS